MKLIKALHATPKAWLLNSVLAPYSEAFTARLERGRYSDITADKYLGGIAHLARWMTHCGLPVRLLDEKAVDQFLGKHLPRCDCPKPVVRVHGDLRAACNHLLAMLREQGVIAGPTTPMDPVADELRRYDEHMRDVRGLTAGTRRGRLRIVQRLLLRKFADRPVVIPEMRPEDVRQFIADQLDLRKTSSNASTLASALRDYFRYRATCSDRVGPLTGVISSPAHWNLASLPRSLSNAEVDRLLSSFTTALPSPKRGYATSKTETSFPMRPPENFYRKKLHCRKSVHGNTGSVSEANRPWFFAHDLWSLWPTGYDQDLRPLGAQEGRRWTLHGKPKCKGCSG